MKRLSLLFAATLALASMAGAQGLKGVGYDANLNHIVARIGLGPNADLDLGGAIMYDGTDDGNDDNNLALGVSAFYLGKLQHWGVVDNYFTAGAVITKLPQKDDNLKFELIAGLQPEVTLLDRIVLSTRFGLDIPVAPNVMINTIGSGISIVGGASFKILW
jgi:hypothetical protein